MTDDTILAFERPVDHDNTVDDGIQQCLKIGSGKSFITFAGAGSGKTYSLEKALGHLREENEKLFLRLGKQVAVITYTNNAADEIMDRVDRSSIFSISTIHSFCWLNIQGFNEDIRQWYLSEIPDELNDLEEKEIRGRAGAASDARKRRIRRLKEKMGWLSEPQVFIYDPNGVNSSQNSLSHADVLKIFAHFLRTKPMMADVLVNKYPFVFIDESQDTDKGIINAFFELQESQADNIVIGLFGDTMQRIFGGGEPRLGKELPQNWEEFDKEMNHRSARRIVHLGNKIRSEDDGKLQFARLGSADGVVRFFLIPHETADKDLIEDDIRTSLAAITKDDLWTDMKSEDTAILLLEHKMASRRLGFLALAEALSKSSKIKDRIFEGDNSELNYFTRVILPLAEASMSEDQFEVMSVLRSNNSPLLNEEVFDTNADDPLKPARLAEVELHAVISDAGATFREVLSTVAKHQLLQIPSKLSAFVKGPKDDILRYVDDQEDADEGNADEIEAWANALETPFWQIKNYRDYVDEDSIYRTHQGVKGNEFDRVMVIMDDDEAGGFMFSYEQYFGAKELSKGTLSKLEAGEETGLDRTRRLFYVTSTRAKKSLVHVIYTSDVSAVRKSLIVRGFASDAEIIEMQR